MNNKIKVSGKRIPFGSVFIVFLVLLFSSVAILNKNQILGEYNLAFIVIFSCVVFFFVTFLSFGFPLQKVKNDGLEIMQILKSSFLLGLFTLPLLLMNSSKHLISANGKINTILLAFSIVVWTIEIFRWKTEQEWGEINKFGEFLTTFWLVSGLLITIGLNFYEYAVYPITLLTNVHSYLDIRLLVSAIFSVYIVSIALKEAFSEDLPDVEHIIAPQITLSKSINDEWISSVVVPFTIVTNILFKIIFAIIDVIWTILAYASIIIWRICSIFFISLYELFLKRSFVEKIAFCLVIVLLLFSSKILTELSYQILMYVNTDSGIWDISIVKTMALNILFLLGITFLSLACMKFLYKEIASFQFQLQVKMTYMFLMLTILCLTGWFLQLLRNIRLLQGFEFPNVGFITISMTIFISIVLVSYVVSQGIKKAHNNVYKK